MYAVKKWFQVNVYRSSVWLVNITHPLLSFPNSVWHMNDEFEITYADSAFDIEKKRLFIFC